MTNPSHTPVLRERLSRAFFRKDDYAMRQGILKLLAIKDSDIRLLTLEQCRDAVDKGLHAGGAFSPLSRWLPCSTEASLNWTSKIPRVAGRIFSP